MGQEVYRYIWKNIWVSRNSWVIPWFIFWLKSYTRKKTYYMLYSNKGICKMSILFYFLGWFVIKLFILNVNIKKINNHMQILPLAQYFIVERCTRGRLYMSASSYYWVINSIELQEAGQCKAYVIYIFWWISWILEMTADAQVSQLDLSFFRYGTIITGILPGIGVWITFLRERAICQFELKE